MIKTEAEYQAALQRLAEDRTMADRQRAALRAMGYSEEQVERGLEPLLTFHAQLAEEVEWYERILKGDYSFLTHVTSLGRLLIALRIARRISQEQLAERLGVDPHEVATDEHNEYYGVTWDRIQAICDALGVRITTNVEEAPERMRELQPALAN